jgi:hypothetical protein
VIPDSTTLATLLGALLIGAAVLATLRVRRVRPASWRATRKLERGLDESSRSRIAEMKAWLQVHDALTEPWFRWRLARAYRRGTSVAARLGRVRIHFVRTALELGMALEARVRAADEQPPLMSPRAAAVVNYGLLLPGDIVIVSGALLAHDTQLSPARAMVSSLAISTTLWLSGKTIGAQLAGPAKSRALLGMAIAALVLSASALGFLRPDDQLIWVALSVMPAFGSAAITAQAKSAPWDKVAHSERRLRRLFHSYRRSIDRLATQAGRFVSAYTVASLRGTAKLTALTNAIVAEAAEAPWRQAFGDDVLGMASESTQDAASQGPLPFNVGQGLGGGTTSAVFAMFASERTRLNELIDWLVQELQPRRGTEGRHPADLDEGESSPTAALWVLSGRRSEDGAEAAKS